MSRVLYNLVLGGYVGEFDDDPPPTRGGDELRFCACSSTARPSATPRPSPMRRRAGKPRSIDPDFDLGHELEAVARLVSGGALATPSPHLDRRLRHPHRSARLAGAGARARGDAVAAFLADMQNQGLLDRVLGRDHVGVRPAGGTAATAPTTAPPRRCSWPAVQ
ncbi:MAG: hypothetical protein U0527_04515 [Candidatus Eisenbacteria bacterium]